MATVTILCLGDSLTEGNDSNLSGFRTYRGRLGQLLSTAGYTVDFVGTRSLAPAIGGDPDHDGYGGAGIDSTIAGVPSLTSRLTTIKAAIPSPDVIIVYAGWNDVYNNSASLATRYETFIGAIRTQWASAKIVLCTLSPTQGNTETSTGAALAAYAAVNAKIRTLAGSSNRYLADLAAGPSGITSAQWIEQILDDARLAPDFTTLAGGFDVPNLLGGTGISSYDGMVAANAAWSATPPNPGRSASNLNFAPPPTPGNPGFVNNVASLPAWFWTFAAQGHGSTNTGVETRNRFLMVKRKSTGAWVTVFQGARGGSIQPWYGGGLARNQSDGLSSFYKVSGNGGIEAWVGDTNPSRGIQDFYGAFSRELIADASCYFVGAQARLALDDPGGTNDIASSNIGVQLGYDAYVQGFDGLHHDYLGFPRAMMEGGSNRWKLLKSTSWTPVLAISADVQRVTTGVRPPWGFWTGAWPYASSSGGYALTEAQLRANPPPIPSLWEGSSQGYASADYFDSIHMLQAGADKIAQIIYDSLRLNSLLDSTVAPPGEIPSGRPTRGNWFSRLTSSRATWGTVGVPTTSAPTVTTTVLPQGVSGVTYGYQLQASGDAPITWSLSGQPSAVVVNASSGYMSGIPASTFSGNVTVTATNAAGSNAAVLPLSVVAAAVAPTITTAATLPTGTLNAAVEIVFAATGTGPFAYAEVGSNCPLGTEIRADGVLVGTYLAFGTFSITVQITGGTALTSTKTFSLSVTASGDPPNTDGTWTRLPRDTEVWVRVPRA